MESFQVRGEQLLVTKLSSANGTRVLGLDSALVLQMFAQRIPPTVLSSTVLALHFLLLAAALTQVATIGGSPRVAFSADVASVEGAVRRALSYGQLPPFRISPPSFPLP